MTTSDTIPKNIFSQPKNSWIAEIDMIMKTALLLIFNGLMECLYGCNWEEKVKWKEITEDQINSATLLYTLLKQSDKIKVTNIDYFFLEDAEKLYIRLLAMKADDLNSIIRYVKRCKKMIEALEVTLLLIEKGNSTRLGNINLKNAVEGLKKAKKMASKIYKDLVLLKIEEDSKPKIQEVPKSMISYSFWKPVPLQKKKSMIETSQEVVSSELVTFGSPLKSVAVNAIDVNEEAAPIQSTIEPEIPETPLQFSAEVQEEPLQLSAEVQEEPLQFSAEVQEGPLQFSAEVQEGPLQFSAEVQEGPLQFSAEVQEGPLQFSVEVQEEPLQLSAEVQEEPLQLSAEVQEEPLQFSAELKEEPLQLSAKVEEAPLQFSAEVEEALSQHSVPEPVTITETLKTQVVTSESGYRIFGGISNVETSMPLTEVTTNNFSLGYFGGPVHFKTSMPLTNITPSTSGFQFIEGIAHVETLVQDNDVEMSDDDLVTISPRTPIRPTPHERDTSDENFPKRNRRESNINSSGLFQNFQFLQPAPGGNLFGNSSSIQPQQQAPNSSSLLNLNFTQSQQQPVLSGNLFGNSSNIQPRQQAPNSGSLFNLNFTQSQQQPVSGSNLFGDSSSIQPQQQAPNSGSLFNLNFTQSQQQPALQAPVMSGFGNLQTLQQQPLQGTNLFSGLFKPQAQYQQPVQGSMQPQQPMLFNGTTFGKQTQQLTAISNPFERMQQQQPMLFGDTAFGKQTQQLPAISNPFDRMQQQQQNLNNQFSAFPTATMSFPTATMPFPAVTMSFPIATMPFPVNQFDMGAISQQQAPAIFQGNIQNPQDDPIVRRRKVTVKKRR